MTIAEAPLCMHYYWEGMCTLVERTNTAGLAAGACSKLQLLLCEYGRTSLWAWLGFLVKSDISSAKGSRGFEGIPPLSPAIFFSRLVPGLYRCRCECSYHILFFPCLTRVARNERQAAMNMPNGSTSYYGVLLLSLYDRVCMKSRNSFFLSRLAIRLKRYFNLTIPPVGADSIF